MDTRSFLIDAAVNSNSLLCFGVDPVLERIPIKHDSVETTILNHFTPIIDALISKKLISAIKPNIAYFAQYGNTGLSALDKIVSIYSGKIPIILDAKRGDIGKSSKAYASECYNVWKADAVTVNPYLGYDSIAPFLRKDKIVYILAKTSNHGSKDFQDLVYNGKRLFVWVAEKSMEWGTGIVVGATASMHLLRELFERTPLLNTPLLIPGIGAQGGSLDAVGYMISKTSCNKYLHRVNVSSGIAYAYEHLSPKQHPLSGAYSTLDISDIVNASVKAAEEFKHAINNAVSNAVSPLDKSKSVGQHTYTSAGTGFSTGARFIEFLVSNAALKFGDFVLKSGRKSPYFIKMDVFYDGYKLFKLAEFYAQRILDVVPDVEAIYGPAYKGIPLSVAISTVLFTNYGKHVLYCSDRKEKKSYGDKGGFIGADISNKNIVIVDDVMTTGETKVSAIDKIKESFNDPKILGVFIAVDREEKWKKDLASKEFEALTGVPVYSITKISDVFKYLHNRKVNGKVYVDDDISSRFKEYMEQYGVK